MRINYLLGFPTFLVIIGLAWASHSHAQWGRSYNENDDLPEVESLMPQEGPQSSFDLSSAGKFEDPVASNNNMLDLAKQFDAMQIELQELRGKIETQDHELKLLKNQSLTAVQKAPNSRESLNSNSGLELKNMGITYKPAGT